MYFFPDNLVDGLARKFPLGRVAVGQIVIRAAQIHEGPCGIVLRSKHVMGLSHQRKHLIVCRSCTALGLVELFTEEEVVTGGLAELVFSLLDCAVLSLVSSLKRMP